MEDAVVAVNVGDSISYEIGSEIASYADAFYSGRMGDLFGEAGLLAKYYSIGQMMLEESAHRDGDVTNPQDHWELECRTWDLVQRLYLERTKTEQVGPPIHSYVSNHALEQYLYQTSTEAAESKVVLDWLQDGGHSPTRLESRGNRWFYTKEHIESRRRLGSVSQSDSIVASIDPDAPIREGKRLEEKDVEFERNLLKTMYLHIRAGEYDQAAEIARESGNQWRAASLQGCVERRDPEVDGTGESATMEGNVNKPLWRRMCYALARQSGIDIYERAMYGALCGDLMTVLPVCPTWDDRMWASFNAMNQSKVETFLKSHGRVQLKQDFPVPNYDHLTSHIILDGLVQHEDEGIRHDAMSPLRMIQARLISNQVDALLLDVQQQLLSVQKGGDANVASSPHVVRIMTHLILALRQMNFVLPEDASNTVLQAYVELLASMRQGDAVALYASQLPPDIAVESLSRYLTLVEDEELRKQQLRLTAESGIDVRATILRTVEIVFEEILSNWSLDEGLIDIRRTLTPDEERSIRALEWLKLDDSLRNETVILGNNLYRKLLLSGKLSAANALNLRMPDIALIPQELEMEDDRESSDAKEEEARMRNAIEYVGYCTLMRALSKYEDWKTLIRQKPQEINGRRDPVGSRQWKSEVARLKLECIVIFKEVLDGNWCDPVELGIPEEDRKLIQAMCQGHLLICIAIFDDMKNLRNMYIPEAVLKLHGVYSAHEGRDVEAAMNLAVLVSERLAEPMQKSGTLKTYVTELSLLGSYLV